ncbi:MAG: hypothetical protein IPJ28_12035 [Betaproteobacteria bacterium]|nr:hypothetical protein [Betaproteobacteria bacterium]
MAVIPLRLGEPPRQLFAMLQPAGGAAPRQHGVLLCNPFGQEAIRAHRLVRVLGDRLAAAGFAVMRFDYYGTGDSGRRRYGGTPAALDRRHRRGRRRTALAIGHLAHHLDRHPPRGQPGGGCRGPRAAPPGAVDPLGSDHRRRGVPRGTGLGARVLDTGRIGWPRHGTPPQPLSNASPGPDDEALGFPLGESLRADIRDISARSFAQCPSPMTVISSADASPCCRVPTQVERSARVHRIASELEWVAISQMRSAVVPSDALQAVNDALGAGP